jgi:hypothetical protein
MGTTVDRTLRRRLRREVALTAIALGLLALTLVSPTWIERLTGVEPDAGSGETEWLTAVVFLIVATGFAWSGRRTMRRRRDLAEVS